MCHAGVRVRFQQSASHRPSSDLEGVSKRLGPHHRDLLYHRSKRIGLLLPANTITSPIRGRSPVETNPCSLPAALLPPRVRRRSDRSPSYRYHRIPACILNRRILRLVLRFCSNSSLTTSSPGLRAFNTYLRTSHLQRHTAGLIPPGSRTFPLHTPRAHCPHSRQYSCPRKQTKLPSGNPGYSSRTC